ncbi:hypothetical protein M9Y10_043452 [Tritrichomonas musculus]|uniref:RRM domain-containing protein n=1 Tax=Tritrichomonas musculus TaxID=1915356 RepID=A0ABR2K0R7_9EUKA
MQDLKTLELPYTNSKATHTLFYEAESALEIKVYNLPLADANENLKDHLSDIFSIFGHIEEVSVGKDVAIVKFQTEKGLQRALSQKKKHHLDSDENSLPEATKGQFGIQRYLDKYAQLHPPIEDLKKLSYDYIKEFEEKEKEMQRASGGRKTVRMTEAEQREILDKYNQKAKAMQSTDFYAFQQRGRPSLATELLSNEVVPRHLKKIPKDKKKK